MESSASAGRVASAVLDPRRWGARAAMRRVFTVFLDGTITIVALVSIGAGLRFSEQGLQWVLSAYALTFGGLLLLGGRRLTCLGAGFRPAAATGLALMAAGSLVLTQVFIHGSYFPDIFAGLLLCGLGIGLAFVTPRSRRSLGSLSRGRTRLGPEQHRRADRRSARRRHRHNRCRLPLPAVPGSAQRREPARRAGRGATSPPSCPAPCWPGSAWRWRSCSPADRGSQRRSCQSRTRRPMPLPQETW
jgi:hypothetical protein